MSIVSRGLSSSRSKQLSSNVLPMLDINKWHGNPEAFAEELRSACHNVGFFLLRHDIPHDIAQLQLDETRRFFQHSTDEKLSISYHDSPSFRGYMRLGVENTAGATDLREQIEYAAVYRKQDRRRSWPPYERLKDHQNPWPSSFQPTLQKATEDYVMHARRVADCIREALCLALGKAKDELDPLFGKEAGDTTLGDDVTNKSSEAEKQNQQLEPPHWVLKLINYPVIQPKENETRDASFGVGGHTDTNFLTLVLQDDVGGLQVFSSGEWIDVPSNLGPGVLVCNLGEQAEILSRGYFLATPHRVLANVGGARDRISVPLFYNPMLSATVRPIVPEISTSANTGDQNPSTTGATSLKWERSEFDPWRRKSNAMLSTVGDNTFKSLARSHLEVFQKHHPDLQLLEDGSLIRK